MLSSFQYTYDVLDRPIRLVAPEGEWSYGYDALGQLTAVTLPTGRLIEYQYDALGNRVSVTDNGTTTAYSANSLNQYTSAGSAAFTYDADGNLASKTEGAETWSFTYDDESRLLEAQTPDGTWAYEYNALGYRVASTHGGQRTEYLIDPGVGILNDLVGEYDGAGDLIAHYVYALGLTSRVDTDGNSAFYHFDGVANTSEVTDTAGAVVNSYRYLPFGEPLTATEGIPNPFTFSGQLGVNVDGSGLTFMRNREYLPEIGQFTTEDPLGIGGGDLNLRRYVYNRPTVAVDPLGLGYWMKKPLGIKSYQHGGPIGSYFNPADWFNLEPAHEHFFFDSPQKLDHDVQGTATGGPAKNVGYAGYLYQEKDSDRSLYDYTDREWYDDDIMREAVNRVGAKTPYFVIPIPWYADNCQSWATRVRAEYHKIKKEREAAAKKTRVVRPKDPNDIVGPEGFGEERWVTVSETLPYTIRFENQSSATAPAQVVTVSHPLDPDLDWRRFRVGSFGWSNMLFEVPEGRSFYNQRLDLTEDLGFFVDVTAGIDIATGEAFWTIATIDPATGEQPEDPLIGFLPPNNDEGIGDGFVTYTIRPLRNAATGSVIDAEARIVFDTEEPIDTPPIFNTVDAGRPSSSVAPLAEASATEEFAVSWSGQDDEGGSALSDFTILVSDGAGPFEPWLQDTTLLEATFAGLRGHSYRFYSTAKDNAGNVEAPPAEADAETATPGGGAISGQKFSDLNGNGVQNDGEPGLEGWTLFLDDNANGRHDPGERDTVTDANGEYSFDGLNAATYRVAEAAQDGWLQTYPTSSVHEVVLSEDQALADVDFGNLQVAGVSGAKFLDADGNGVRDPGEPGLVGWTIFLDEDGDGELDAGEQSTTTDATGDYSFRFLMPATYTVAEVLQPRWTQTHPVGGVHVVGLGPGQQATSTDFGNVKAPEIHGMKFSDVDGDGVRDPGEPGLEGWTVFLDANGNGELDPGETSTVTGLGGEYSLVGLAPGAYRVAEVVRAGWMQTHPPGGGHELTLAVGQEARGVDFGNMELAQIHGVKFDDRDGDGVKDPGEPGMGGWTVYLDSNGSGVLDAGEPSTTTNATGRYWFMDLMPGTYWVAEVLQEGWEQTSPEFVALLQGGSEAPPVATDAFGFARFSLDEDGGALSFDVSFSGVGSETAGLGMHRGGAGENGPVVHDLAADAGVQPTEFGSPVSGQVGLSAQDLDDLSQGNLYLNLSTDDYALGEIRGQIVSSTAHQIVLTSGMVVEDRDFGNTRTIRPTFSIVDVTVDESVGVATLTIALDPPVTTSDMTVEYATSDGTARAPDDYEATSSTATMPAGQASTTVTVSIVDDELDEPEETFTVQLSNPVEGAEVDPAADSATVTILASDVATPSFDPKDQVQLDPGGIVVTWATAGEHDGHVEWALTAGELAANPTVATDARGPLAGRLNRRTHRVEVRGVPAGSTVHYNVISGGVTHPDGPFQATIPSTPLTDVPRGISGLVAYGDGTAGTECLVYVQVGQPGLGDSLVINTMTNGGRYSAEMGNLRLGSDIDTPLDYDPDGPDATIIVTALCDGQNVGVVSRTTAEADKLVVAGRVSEYTGADVTVAPAVEEQVPLATGQNLITLPVAPIDGLTAVGLAQQVAEQGGEVAQVSRWDGGTQSYEIWRPGGSDIELQVGEGYFVLVARTPSDGVWRVLGRRIAAPAPIELVVGLNLIGVPATTPAGGYDTASLVQAIGAQGGTAVQVVDWDTRTQTFVLWSAASPGANVSPIEDELGYFVLVTDASGSAFEP